MDESERKRRRRIIEKGMRQLSQMTPWQRGESMASFVTIFHQANELVIASQNDANSSEDIADICTQFVSDVLSLGKRCGLTYEAGENESRVRVTTLEENPYGPRTPGS